MTNENSTQFSGGEFTPQIDARSDIEKFKGGCRVLENMIPDTFGDVTRRPGTEKIVVGNGFACYYPPVVPDPTKTGISTAEELQNIENDLTGDYELLNSIDMSDVTDWIPIGFLFKSQGPTKAFSGTFEGHFFTISNLTINNPQRNDVGLFAALISPATITNLVLKNIIINSDVVAPSRDGSEFIAPLAGFVPGQCIITQVAAINCQINMGAPDFPDFPDARPNRVGGLIGGAQTGAHAIFTRCHADTTITVTETEDTGTSGVGGFRGSGGCEITDCYAIGNITGSSPALGDPDGSSLAGGFVGRLLSNGAPNQSFITNCYSKGAIDYGPDTDMGFAAAEPANGVVVTSSYWDTQASGHGTTQGDASGKTTAQMFREATFVDWDFDTVWEIEEGISYPTLRWLRLANIKEVCQPL